MTADLQDLAELRQHVRLAVAALDGDPITGEQVGVARDLADWLRRREGRDVVMVGDGLLEASACLGGLAKALGILDDPGAIVLINVLGYAGYELGNVAGNPS